MLFYLSALNVFAADAGDYFNLALSQYYGNDYSAAVTNLKRAIQLSPGNWKAHQLLGYCAYQMNDNQDALAQCQESLKLNGDNPRLKSFVDWLKTPEPRKPRNDDGAYFEGKAEAQMPPPPDLDPDRKPNGTLEDLAVPTPTPKAPNDPFKNFQFQLGPGLEFFGQNFKNPGTVGLGGELGFGYAWDDHWSLWLTEAMYFLSQYDSFYRRNYEVKCLETTFSARYAFGDGPFRPYLGAGVGVFADNSFYNTDHLLQGSLGAQLKLGGGWSTFVEAKGNFILESFAQNQFYMGNPNYFYPNKQVIAIDYPINAGVILDLGGDHGGDNKSGTPPSNGNFFIKMGLGFTLASGDYYSTVNDMQVNTTSIAAGYDFLNHFSFYTNLERFPGDWAVLANLQYTLVISDPFQPYLFGGLGLEFPDGPDFYGENNAAQFGAGMALYLNPTLDLFIELKDYNASNLRNFTNPYQNGYAVLETGLKFNFSGSRDQTTPNLGPQLEVSAPGHIFVELAGGIDLPTQNWQTAYGLGSGGKFSVGYGFNDGWALQLDVEDFDYSGTNYVGSIGDHELLFLPTVRYLLLQKGIRPYLSAGAGLDVEVSWGGVFGPVQVGNFDMALGAGLEVPFDPLDSLFVEGKYNFIFADGVIGQDIPLLAGIRFGFN